MIPDVRKCLLRLAETEGDLGDNTDLFSSKDQNSVYLTSKTYKSQKGVATKLHAKTGSDRFMIKGPMGKGCNITPSGAHVAFGAGTGVLVYLDVVARLILQNTDNLP